MHPRRRSGALVALLLVGCTTESAVDRETSVPVGTTTTTAPTADAMTASTIAEVSSTKRQESGATTTLSTTPSTTTMPEPTTTLAPLAVQATVPAAPPQAQTPALPVPQAPPAPNAPEAALTLGTIEIPRIGLNMSLFEGITIPTLNKGPGHWPGTALPGAIGNVVVGGHRTSKARPFRHLEQLLPGDEVIFTTDSGRFVYHVVRTEIVKPDAMWIVNQTEAYTATLFACNPVGSTKERIVVFLELSV